MLTFKIKKYLKIANISVQDSLAYKGRFLGEVFFFALLIFLFTRLWSVVYAQKPGFLGYTANQMCWYIILTEFLALSSVKIFFTFAKEIKEGQISYQLLRPYHYILYHLANMSGELFIKILFNLGVAALLAFLFCGPLNSFSAAESPLLMLTFLGSFLLDFFIQTCLGLTAFWLEENTAIYWIYSKLALVFGILLPQDIFPEGIQTLLAYLPWRYLYYGPARLALGFSYELWLEVLTGQGIFILLSSLLSVIIFHKGKKKVVHNGG